jgi:hypothetical protein
MSASISPWTASGMKDKNRSLEAPVRAFLEQLVREPSRHALFMNMLSMLEHMGSRKIMLSQMNRTLTEETLSHLSERRGTPISSSATQSGSAGQSGRVYG